MKMTPERIAEALARCEAASPGPWHTVGNTLYIVPENREPPYEEGLDWFAMPGNADTAAFIAAARTDLPDALAELTEARAEVERLLRLLRDYQAAHPGHERGSCLCPRCAMADAPKETP